MKRFFANLRNIFKIPELRRKVLVTLALILVYRIGRHIPVPGVNADALTSFFQAQKGTLFGLFDLFSGGNLTRATIFALGIMPYISSSIIFQLLVTVIPYLEKLSKEGEAGRKKITQYTRYGTVVLSIFQGSAISLWLEGLNWQGIAVVTSPGWGFRLMTILTLTAGTAFIMWLGEKITEFGVGNGISLIIFAGIVAALPGGILRTVNNLIYGEMDIVTLIVVLAIIVAVVMAVVYMQQAQRRIRVQYAKRIVGRKVYGGQSTHIPLRVNTAGVIPVIFASSIIMFPQTILTFVGGRGGIVEQVAQMLIPGQPLYVILDVVLIVFFAYFYTAVVLNPQDMAENMKKYGGFIPGIRPGRNTAQYIDRILTRITLAGGLFLAAIDVLPTVLITFMKVPFYFGGTGLLIVVGVALDTMRQVESHLLMRHYDGFVKKGRLRGRV
ncbi:MAG: preprotein translocase subunit SecY [candidate division Zixibacteria bacterium]|nr:preprotein translocase subunit SecY [candidate division Zixibacteria bacterium]